MKRVVTIAYAAVLCGCYYSPWEDCRYKPAGEEYVSEPIEGGGWHHYTFRPEVVIDNVHFEISSSGAGGIYRHAPHSIRLQSLIEKGTCREVEIERFSVRREGEEKAVAELGGKRLEFRLRKTYGNGRNTEGMIAFYDCILPEGVTPKDGKFLLVEVWASVTTEDAVGKPLIVKGKFEFVLLPDVRHGWFKVISV